MSRANVFCTPGSLIQTSVDEIAGCSMWGEICQLLPRCGNLFLNRKALWEFEGEGSMSSQLTESGGGDVLELWSRYAMNNLMPWWVNLDQIKLLLNTEAGILVISKQNMTGISLHRLDTECSSSALSRSWLLERNRIDWGLISFSFKDVLSGEETGGK